MKFENYIYQGEQYNVNTLWEEMQHSEDATRKKYDKNIFCPLCEKAPLTICYGSEMRYLKVLESDMKKHSQGCSFIYKKAGKKETTEFYSDIDTSKIETRLEKFIDNLMSKGRKNKVVQNNKTNTKNKNDIIDDENFLTFMSSKSKQKRLPQKSLLSRNLYEDSGVIKIYYGKCCLYISKYIKEAVASRYYLKIFHPETKSLIGDISISPIVFRFLEKKLKDIPMGEFVKLVDMKTEATLFNICFAGKIEEDRFGFKCNLVDSRMIIVAKI